MELVVIGCHGGETPRHRTSAFLVDNVLAIDAGSLTSGLDLKAQSRLRACLVSHAHLDHIRDLATIADNRAQDEAPALVVAGTRVTIGLLKKHFFNNKLWPDFTEIPSVARPTIRYLELDLEKPTVVAGYTVRAIRVSHTIDTCAFIVEGKGGTIAYSGDTGPTDRLWEVLGETKDLRALLMEVSFPNAEQRVARLSGHHTPASLAKDAAKLENARDINMLMYHIKPHFQREVERELAKLKGLNLTVLSLGDRFIL